MDALHSGSAPPAARQLRPARPGQWAWQRKRHGCSLAWPQAPVGRPGLRGNSRSMGQRWSLEGQLRRVLAVAAAARHRCKPARCKEISAPKRQTAFPLLFSTTNSAHGSSQLPCSTTKPHMSALTTAAAQGVFHWVDLDGLPLQHQLPPLPGLARRPHSERHRRARGALEQAGCSQEGRQAGK